MKITHEGEDYLYVEHEGVEYEVTGEAITLIKTVLKK